jgi:hypothetical protein
VLSIPPGTEGICKGMVQQARVRVDWFIRPTESCVHRPLHWQSTKGTTANSLAQRQANGGRITKGIRTPLQRRGDED